MRHITQIFIFIFIFQKLLFALEAYPSLHQTDNYGLIGAKDQFKLLHEYTSESGAPLPLSAMTSLTYHANLNKDDEFCVNNWSRMKLYIPAGTTSFKVIFTTRTNTNYRVHATFKAINSQTINHIENATKIAFSDNIINQFTVSDQIINIGSLSISNKDILTIGNGGWLYIDIVGDTAIRPSAYYNNYNAKIAIAPKYVIGDTQAFNNWLSNTTFKDNGDPVDDVNSLNIINTTCSSGVETYKISLNENIVLTNYPKTLTFDSIHQTPSSSSKVGVLEQYLDNNRSLQIINYKYNLNEFASTNDTGECVSKRQYMKMYIPGGTELFSLDFSADNDINQKILFKFGSNSDMDLSTAVPFSIENLKTNTVYEEISGAKKLIFSNLGSLIGESGGWLYMSAINTSEAATTGHLSLSLSINDQEAFEKWLLATKFTSNGDPSEVSANSNMSITDNYCDDGIQNSILTLNQSGTLYDPNTGSVVVDKHAEARSNCTTLGGSWIEGANVCDGASQKPSTPTPPPAISSSTSISSSGSVSSSSPVNNHEEDRSNCATLGGSWIEGANVCDGASQKPSTPTPPPAISSSTSISSSGSVSSSSPVNNHEEDRSNCATLGGSWIEGANVCDGASQNPAPPPPVVSAGSSSSVASDTTTDIVNIITNQSYTVKGHFTHYGDGVSDWIYSTPSGKFIAKLNGRKSTGEINWNILHSGSNSYAHYSEENSQITFDSHLNEKSISGKTHNISGYIIRYDNSRFGWIYTSRDGSIIAALKGIDSNGKLIWSIIKENAKTLSPITADFSDNHTVITFRPSN